MSNKAISVENLYKSYRLGELDRYYDMRDAITNLLKSPFRYFSNNGHGKKKDSNENILWALDDLNLDVSHGEITGIIGKNGAGKSTLLKILSRITFPTRGTARINGRVGCLLEVGTGFHQELTGRENIFLNGSILGMSRKEIQRKFDEIVDFAEVEKFLDTPVKRYSSGMYVRLAFAVAAHLEPEILLIDEVLAVGDIAFQKKCLGKMDDVSKEGRTILFVSHNLESVSQICQKTIVIDQGRKKFEGKTSKAIEQYLNIMNIEEHEYADTNFIYSNAGYKENEISVKSIEILDLNHNPKNFVYTWDDFIIRTIFHSGELINNAIFELEIKSRYGVRLFYVSTSLYKKFPFDIKKGLNHLDIKLKGIQLSAGEYIIGVGLSRMHGEKLIKLDEIAKLRISEKDIYNCGDSPEYDKSVLALDYDWEKI